MTVRDIQAFLLEQYGTHLSSAFISTVTDAVMAEVTAWQVRPCARSCLAHTSLSCQQFDNLYLTLLQRYAELVQMFPVPGSEYDHQRIDRAY